MTAQEEAAIITVVAVGFILIACTFIGIGIFMITQGRWSKRDILVWSCLSFLFCLVFTILYVFLKA